MSETTPDRCARWELREPVAEVPVQPEEYRRLLGYPAEHVPGERAQELARWARQWYGEHGRPWLYLREVRLEVGSEAVWLDGMEFRSRQLHGHLRRFGAGRAMVMAVSAGPECEEHARQLWEDAKPDEYFFLEMYGSAVVEQLAAGVNGRICGAADEDGLVAIPHFSPGYTAWNVEDQGRLFELIVQGATAPLPGPLQVLASGMPKPKKSLLAVVGLAPRPAEAGTETRRIACETCALSPCRYRRSAYRPSLRVHDPAAARAPETAAVDSRYTINVRALEKWAGERVSLTRQPEGAIDACFRFDGTTCSNLGQPLAFEYRVRLSAPPGRPTIVAAECRPVGGDEGHRSMCAYLTDARQLMAAIAAEKPLLGRPLDDVFAWHREAAPTGCYCTADSREHKWGLALEAIHYALARAATDGPAAAAGTSPRKP